MDLLNLFSLSRFINSRSLTYSLTHSVIHFVHSHALSQFSLIHLLYRHLLLTQLILLFHSLIPAPSLSHSIHPTSLFNPASILCSLILSYSLPHSLVLPHFLTIPASLLSLILPHILSLPRFSRGLNSTSLPPFLTQSVPQSLLLQSPRHSLLYSSCGASCCFKSHQACVFYS